MVARNPSEVGIGGLLQRHPAGVRRQGAATGPVSLRPGRRRRPRGLLGLLARLREWGSRVISAAPDPGGRAFASRDAIRGLSSARPAHLIPSILCDGPRAE